MDITGKRDAESRPAPTMAEEVGGQWVRLPGCRVLLAATGSIDRSRIVKILALADIQTDVVEDGRGALQAILQAQDVGLAYHLVLMDMQLPDLDGFEATRVLRLQGYEGAIIALTANGDDAVRERCLAAGCDDVEITPVRRAVLLGLLASHFVDAITSAA